LPTMSQECDKVASRAAVENLDHLAYLQRLCELELIERERRAAERRLKAARFPQTKTLDEFDFGQQPSTTELLFDVLSTAYERQSLIVTTNLPFEQWTEVLGSERLTGAALDRLTHRCHILEAKGESFRLRDARRRQRRTSGPS
jgi:DNA replication protein DnaC